MYEYGNIIDFYELSIYELRKFADSVSKYSIKRAEMLKNVRKHR